MRQPNAMRNAAGRTDAGPRGDARRAPACRRVPARAGSNPGPHQHPQFLRIACLGTVCALGSSASNDLSQVEALSRALGARQGGDSVALPNRTGSRKRLRQPEHAIPQGSIPRGSSQPPSGRLSSLDARSAAVALRNQSRLGDSGSSRTVPQLRPPRRVEGAGDFERLRHRYWSLPSDPPGIASDRKI